MAIRFRCQHCHTLQSIATRKAGTMVRCAACDAEVLVPTADEAGAPEATPALKRDDAAATNGSGEIESEDRVALPDDLFDFDDDDSPSNGAVEAEEAVHPVQFTSHDMPGAGGMLTVEPGPPVELPPLRPRSEEIPEQFALPIRKSNIDDEMDLTPMVDVVFQLLIFFMVTASFALHKTIQTPTPDPEQKGAAQSLQTLDELEGVSILVRIDAQNAITIDDDPLPDGASVEDALVDKMRQEQKSEIIISADSAAWHRTVVNVIDAANAVGMQKIRLATRSGPEE
jgi:biopolymer transport protein ExbD